MNWEPGTLIKHKKTGDYYQLLELIKFKSSPFGWQPIWVYQSLQSKAKYSRFEHDFNGFEQVDSYLTTESST